MKRTSLTLFLIIITYCAWSQSEPHYTMFMFNKLIYNPAYAGSKDDYSFIADYRHQWVGINGAPKTFNLSADGPLKPPPINKIALGFSSNNEEIGVLQITDLKAYYSYRVFFEKFILSFA